MINSGQDSAGREAGNLKVLVATGILLLILFSVWQRVQLFSSGQMDEHDYLFVGKTLLSGLSWPTHSYIFGSDISWYLLGIGEKFIGGLPGARTVAATAGIASLVGIYLFVFEIWSSRRTALVATLLLAVTANHIYISRIATYDIISFALFSLALTPLLRSCQPCKQNSSTINRVVYLLIGTLLLALAVLAKYPTVLYLPFVALPFLLQARKQLLIGSILFVSCIGLYGFRHWEELNILYAVQIQGTHIENTTHHDLVLRSFYNIGFLLVLSVAALLWARTQYRANTRLLVTLLLLILFSTPHTIYHLQGKNLISLYKHLVFAQYFLVVVSAWFVVDLYDRCKGPFYRSRKRLLLSVLAGAFGIYVAANSWLLDRIQKGYPDSRNLVEHIKALPDVENMTVLSEDPYLVRYHLFDELSQDNIRETSWLDNDRDGVRTHQDVIDAIWDRKFRVVVLNDAVHPERNTVYRSVLNQRGYQISYTEDYVVTPVMTKNRAGSLSLYYLSQSQTTFNSER